MDRVHKLAVGSIVVGLAVLGIKYFAYALTGSVALYSDALESIINVATAITAFLAVRLSAVPEDTNHPYGHYKAEYLSAVLEGVLIVVAAVFILIAAYRGFLTPHPLDSPFRGLLVNAVATIINATWCTVLMKYGRRWRSTALLADARHLWTDVVTSAGVLVGVALVAGTGYLRLDSIIAGLVALNILWSGWKLMRESIGGLMDEAVAPDKLAAVRDIISRHATGALEAHNLRTRAAGRATFIDFHLVVPGTMTVSESHVVCDKIEDALHEAIPDAKISIHVEPEAKAKHPGGVPVL